MLSTQQSDHELVDWKGREHMQTSEAQGPQLYFIPQMAKGKRGAACEAGNPARGLSPLSVGLPHCPVGKVPSLTPNTHHYRTCSPPRRVPVPRYCCIHRSISSPFQAGGEPPPVERREPPLSNHTGAIHFISNFRLFSRALLNLQQEFS